MNRKVVNGCFPRLFSAERNYRIDFRRADRGNEARDDRDEKRDWCSAAEGNRIACVNSVEKVRDQRRKRQREDQTESDADRCKAKPLR